MRASPYYSVIQDFFEKSIGKFVDEAHTCKCNQCGKNMIQLQDCTTANSSATSTSTEKAIIICDGKREGNEVNMQDLKLKIE